MSVPPQIARFRKSVRWFYTWVGSVIFAAAAPLVAMHFVHTGTLWGRVAGVLVGAVALLPMIVVVTVAVRAGDEYQRRIHLVALALSFGSALLLLTVLDWLARARFIDPPPLQILWLGFAVLWLIWLIAVKRRFERES